MATEQKHTPGPWTTNGGIVRTVDENGITVRKIATAHGEFAEAEKIANARLIAAAPDMRKGVERLLALIEDHERVIRMLGGEVVDAHNDKGFARAALAKAEG